MSMRKLKMAAIGVLVSSFAVTSLWAHHGFGVYSEELFEIEGVVKDFYFGNPHPQLALEVDGKTWDVWLAAYPRVVYVCFDANVLAVGDTVRATGHRITSTTRLEMKTLQVEHKGKVYDFYPPDNPDQGPNANPTRKREGPCDYELNQ